MVRFFGHAIECRINAEHPETFVPNPGMVTQYHPPGGLNVRCDSAVYAGYRIPPYYDSMIAKLIVSGFSREGCLLRLRRSLEEYVIDGVTTTTPLHLRLMENEDFQKGDYDIHWLENFLAEGQD
jgi:acetyl-CoA carboxylase biotin carboxylase subunit